MSVVQNSSSDALIQPRMRENRRPPKESFCEFEIIEEYQREKNKRNRSKSKDTDLVKKIKDLTARNAEIEQLYKNLKMKQESCSNTYNSHETETSKIDTGDEFFSGDHKLRIHSVGNQNIKVNTKSTKSTIHDKSSIINKKEIEFNKRPSTKVAEIKEILEKELLEHKIRKHNKVKIKEDVKVICQNCSGLIEIGDNSSYKSNQNQQIICQNCSGEINNRPASRLPKSKRKKPKKETKIESSATTSVQENLIRPKANNTVIVQENIHPVIKNYLDHKSELKKPETKSLMRSPRITNESSATTSVQENLIRPKANNTVIVQENIHPVIKNYLDHKSELKKPETKSVMRSPRITKPSNNGEPEKSKLRKNRSCSPILRPVATSARPCQATITNEKYLYDKTLQFKLEQINLPLGDQLSFNLQKEPKSQFKSKLPIKEISKVERKELSFSNLNLLPIKGLYSNLEQPTTAATQTSNLKMADKPRSRSKSALPSKTTSKPLIPRNRSCDNETPSSSKSTLNRKRQPQMLPSNALKEMSKVFELERAAAKYNDGRSKKKSFSPRNLQVNQIGKHTINETQKIFSNNKFHSSKVLPSERIIEVASKVLRDQKISFTVEGIEPPKKLDIIKGEHKRFNRGRSLHTRVFKGIDLISSDIRLLNHGNSQNKFRCKKISDDSLEGPHKLQFNNKLEQDRRIKVEEESNHDEQCYSSTSQVSSKRSRKRKPLFLSKRKGFTKTQQFSPKKHTSNEDNSNLIKTNKQVLSVVNSATQTINFNKFEPPSLFGSGLINQNSFLLNKLTYENLPVEKKDVAVEANLIVQDNSSQSFECLYCKPSHIILSTLENQECRFMSYILNKLQIEGNSENTKTDSLNNSVMIDFGHQANTETNECDSAEEKSSSVRLNCDNNCIIKAAEEIVPKQEDDINSAIKVSEEILPKKKKSQSRNEIIEQEMTGFGNVEEKDFDDKNPFKYDTDTAVPNIKKYAHKEIIELENYLNEILQKISSKNCDDIKPIDDFLKHEEIKMNTIFKNESNSDTFSSRSAFRFKPHYTKKRRKSRLIFGGDGKNDYGKNELKTSYTREFCLSSSSCSSIESLYISKSTTSLSVCQKSISQRFSKDFQTRKGKDFDVTKICKRNNKSQQKTLKKLVKLRKISKQSVKEESFTNIVVLSVSSTNNLKSASYLRKFCDKLISNSLASTNVSDPQIMVEDKRIISKEPFYINYNAKKEDPVETLKTSVDSLDVNKPICPLTNVFNTSQPNYTYFVYNAQIIPDNKLTKPKSKPIIEETTTNFKQQLPSTSTKTTFATTSENNNSFIFNDKKTQKPPSSSKKLTFGTTSQDNNSFIFTDVKRSPISFFMQQTPIKREINLEKVVKTIADTSPKIAPKKSNHKMKSKKGSFSNNVSSFSEASNSSCRNFIIKYITKNENKDRPSTASQATPSMIKKLVSKSKSALDFNSSLKNLFSNESGYDTCKTSKSNSIKTFFKRGSILDLFRPIGRKNLNKSNEPSGSSINLEINGETSPVESTSSINVFNCKSSKTVLWLNFNQRKKKQSEKKKSDKSLKARFLRKAAPSMVSKITTKSTNTPKVSRCPCLADYEAKKKECQNYAEKVLLESTLRKEGYIKQYNDFKEIPLDVLMGKRMINSPKPKRYSDKILAKPVPTQTPPRPPPKETKKVESLPKLVAPKYSPVSFIESQVSFDTISIMSLQGFSESSDEEEIANHDNFNVSATSANESRVIIGESSRVIMGESDVGLTNIADEKKISEPSTSSDKKLTDKEVFDKLLVKYETTEGIAEKLSHDDEFFEEQLAVVPSIADDSDSIEKIRKEAYGSKYKNLAGKFEPDDSKVRGPRFHDKPTPATTIKNDCDVQADDIGTCFARGFRPDNLMLSGDACFNLNKQDKIKMSPHVLKNTESIIDFSERETPLDFLLALGFMVDEASNALKDDDIRSRLLAAITEARVWINKITTTQGTLLYLVAYKSRPDTMRYFLQLVEAIINKRINNAIKLDGFLRVLEQVEDGRIQMINILGEDKFEDEENEEKIVKKQMKHLFVNVYTIAETEAKNRNVDLTNFQISLLRTLVAKYRAGLHPHLELIARYIGQGLLLSEIQLEAAMIFLSRLDTADVKLKEFENYCGIQCEKS